MKRQYGKIMQRIAALMLGAFLFASPLAQAATNTAFGDIAGVGPDLDNSNTFELLTASTPTLVKAAFLTSDGSALLDGDILPAGTSVDFLIYLVNEASLDILDVSIQDNLTGFTYTAGTIRVFNTTLSDVCAIPAACDAGEELIIYGDVVGETPLTDGVLGGDDVASFVGTQVDIGDEVQTNAQQDVTAGTILAVVFTAVLN